MSKFDIHHKIIVNQNCLVNLVILDTRPGVIACPNMLTLVLPVSVTVSVLPVMIDALPKCNSRQLSFSAVVFLGVISSLSTVDAIDIFGFSPRVLSGTVSALKYG